MSGHLGWPKIPFLIGVAGGTASGKVLLEIKFIVVSYYDKLELQIETFELLLLLLNYCYLRRKTKFFDLKF